jgi:hypothetical protein
VLYALASPSRPAIMHPSHIQRPVIILAQLHVGAESISHSK